MYKIVGYIKCDGIATGFLIPIYQLGSNGSLFFHHLSADYQKIESFTPYIKEHYGTNHTRDFVSLEGPEKTVGDTSFFVFKYRNTVYSGDRTNAEFITHMKDAHLNLTNEFLRLEIEKILQ